MAMNSLGRDLAAGRVCPAAERLDADDRLAALVDDRLVNELQAVIVDCFAQVSFKQLAAGQIGIHCRVIDACAVASLVLGTVQRHVGVSHDVGRGSALVVDHRDPHRGADDDVLAVDDIGRTYCCDNALREPHHLFAVASDRGDHRELVATKARHQIAAAQRVRKPQGHIADKLVADMMAERIVHVFEVIEVDVEHGRRRGAAANFLNHRFQPFTEEDAVGKAAERIVHGEMTQPQFAGRNRRGGAAHVTQDESGKQREAGDRDSNERHHVVHDLGAGLFRSPGKAHNGVAIRTVHVKGEIAGRYWILFDPAQIGQPQLCSDTRERAFVDEFHRHDDRRNAIGRSVDAIGRPDRNRSDHRRPAHQAADGCYLQMCVAVGHSRLIETERIPQVWIAPAHVVDH